ncbi:protein EMSY-LIKE 4 isoform X2 [Pyrus x bretschneideri]|uniref:protein EMSY-LIKE 4 isoform X2 n=1 Tax=Pyrus x bretschneideri TaxID=225117 RepID=UPI00202F73BF|nr:protein EMSY-LIKE 4 isoform X2 [Pyrus x bretschneideri]
MGNHKHNHGIGTERMSPATKPHGKDLWDMELHIHRLETEAYHAVLKAFSAQSNNLTWAREALMTELRRELNITDDEHGQLLIKIKSDQSVKMIREWRNGAPCAQEYSEDAPGYPPPQVVINAEPRKLETTHPPVSKSQKCVSYSHSCKETTPSAAPYQGQVSSDKSTDPAMLSSEKGRQAMNISCHDPQPQVPSGSRSTGLVKPQSKIGFRAPGSDNFKESCDFIRIRATDQVIHQAYKLLSQERVVPLHIEKAKLILREHERAILDALDKLPDVSEMADSPKQMQHKYPHEELPGMGREMLIRSDLYGQAGRLAY